MSVLRANELKADNWYLIRLVGSNESWGLQVMLFLAPDGAWFDEQGDEDPHFNQEAWEYVRQGR